MKVRVLLRLLTDDGWMLVRTRGSHRQFKHPTKPSTVTVSGKPGIEIPPGTLNSETGLSKIFLLTSVLITYCNLVACREGPTPAFVEDLIASHGTNAIDAPQEIWRYRLKGELVYYVPPQCCDIPSALYNQNGEVICSPDGGLTGSGDGLCPNFFKDRKNGKLIWEKAQGEVR